MRHPARSLGALAALATLAPTTLSAQGGRQLFEHFGNGYSRSGGYGTSIAIVGDLNGDSFDDIAVGDPTEELNPSGGGGLVEAIR